MDATKAVDNAKKVGKDIIDSMGADYTKIVLVVVIFILLSLMSWIYNTLRKQNVACDKLEKMYRATNTFISKSYLSSVGNIQQTSDYNGLVKDRDNICILRNYYIKAAYNCCCGDGYKNNFVNECALVTCIKQGARCLDFEIYSYNDEPIIAASTANNNSIKETYNSLKLIDAFDILNAQAFNGEIQSHNDPMIIHLRIMSENRFIYDKIAKYIQSNLVKGANELLLQSEFTIANPSYESQNVDKLLEMPITLLHQKFIIAVHTNHKTILDNSKLSNYTNFKSGTNKFQLLRYNQMAASGTENPLIQNAARAGIIMVIPSINNSIVNYDYLNPLGNGCQIIAMKFQNMDNNLISYNKFFKEKGGYPFVLKPKKLRRDLESDIQVTPGNSLEVIPITGGALNLNLN
jgi:hypothetical protein